MDRGGRVMGRARRGIIDIRCVTVFLINSGTLFIIDNRGGRGGEGRITKDVLD